jgi:uncharacterized protein (DUF1015 family)
MAQLIPFRALRPVPLAAPRVAAVPYDVVTTEEARALAKDEPLSFLHVTRSEIDLPDNTPPYDPSVYARAADNFVMLADAAPLIMDYQPSLYFYRQQMGGHVQTGLAACFSVDEYEQGVIKKHEKTRPDKEDDRTRHILELRAQTGVVFLTYRASSTIEVVTTRVCAETPLYDFTAADGVRHTVWMVPVADVRLLEIAFNYVPALYIADGHHRAASAARARAELRAQGEPTTDADSFIAVAFPDTEVRILPYHRVVKDLNGHSPESLLTALRSRMTLTAGVPEPRRPEDVSMFLDGRWHTLVLPASPPGTSRSEGLGVAVLQREVLGPVLGIGDVRIDKRIEFVGGGRGTAALEQLVTSGHAAVAFSMFPVTVDDLIAIADEGGIMPPKSTWFEPKLRDGLLVHQI